MPAARGTGLRVCMVVNNLDIGGLEKVALNLIRQLRNAGHDPHLICLDGAGKMFSEVDLPPEKVLVLHKRVRRFFGLSFDPSLVVAIRAFARDRRLDVLHAHNLAPLVYAGLAGRLLWSRPRIVYSEHNQIYSASLKVRRRFTRYIRLADHVIAVSHDLRRALHDAVGDAVPISVVHNGIDPLTVPAGTRDEVRASLGVTHDVVFGMIAVLSKQKGIDYLLEAARRVTMELPTARFLVVGDGPLREDLLRRREELGLTDRVIFTGYRSDIPRVMAGIDVYVQSSLWEGLPIVLLEALAAGKPIVTTAVGGNREVVEDGVNGLVVPPADADALADALLRMARDEHLRAQSAERNPRKFAGQFASEAMLTGHLDTYNGLLKRN